MGYYAHCTGMIGPNHPKTNIVVPVVLRMIVVPEGATQIIRFVVPGTAAHRAGGSFVGSFPLLSNK